MQRLQRSNGLALLCPQTLLHTPLCPLSQDVRPNQCSPRPVEPPRRPQSGSGVGLPRPPRAVHSSPPTSPGSSGSSGEGSVRTRRSPRLPLASEVLLRNPVFQPPSVPANNETSALDGAVHERDGDGNKANDALDDKRKRGGERAAVEAVRAMGDTQPGEAATEAAEMVAEESNAEQAGPRRDGEETATNGEEVEKATKVTGPRDPHTISVSTTVDDADAAVALQRRHCSGTTRHPVAMAIGGERSDSHGPEGSPESYTKLTHPATAPLLHRRLRHASSHAVTNSDAESDSHAQTEVTMAGVLSPSPPALPRLTSSAPAIAAASPLLPSSDVPPLPSRSLPTADLLVPPPLGQSPARRRAAPSPPSLIPRGAVDLDASTPPRHPEAPAAAAPGWLAAAPAPASGGAVLPPPPPGFLSRRMGGAIRPLPSIAQSLSVAERGDEKDKATTAVATAVPAASTANITTDAKVKRQLPTTRGPSGSVAGTAANATPPAGLPAPSLPPLQSPGPKLGATPPSPQGGAVSPKTATRTLTPTSPQALRRVPLLSSPKLHRHREQVTPAPSGSAVAENAPVGALAPIQLSAALARRPLAASAALRALLGDASLLAPAPHSPPTSPPPPPPFASPSRDKPPPPPQRLDVTSPRGMAASSTPTTSPAPAANNEPDRATTAPDSPQLSSRRTLRPPNTATAAVATPVTTTTTAAAALVGRASTAAAGLSPPTPPRVAAVSISLADLAARAASPRHWYLGESLNAGQPEKNNDPLASSPRSRGDAIRGDSRSTQGLRQPTAAAAAGTGQLAVSQRQPDATRREASGSRAVPQQSPNAASKRHSRTPPVEPPPRWAAHRPAASASTSASAPTAGDSGRTGSSTATRIQSRGTRTGHAERTRTTPQPGREPHGSPPTGAPVARPRAPATARDIRSTDAGAALSRDTGEPSSVPKPYPPTPLAELASLSASPLPAHTTLALADLMASGGKASARSQRAQSKHTAAADSGGDHSGAGQADDAGTPSTGRHRATHASHSSSHGAHLTSPPSPEHASPPPLQLSPTTQARRLATSPTAASASTSPASTSPPARRTPPDTAPLPSAVAHASSPRQRRSVGVSIAAIPSQPSHDHPPSPLSPHDTVLRQRDAVYGKDPPLSGAAQPSSPGAGTAGGRQHRRHRQGIMPESSATAMTDVTEVPAPIPHPSLLPPSLSPRRERLPSRSRREKRRGGGTDRERSWL